MQCCIKQRVILRRILTNKNIIYKYKHYEITRKQKSLYFKENKPQMRNSLEFSTQNIKFQPQNSYLLHPKSLCIARQTLSFYAIKSIHKLCCLLRFRNAKPICLAFVSPFSALFLPSINIKNSVKAQLFLLKHIFY